MAAKDALPSPLVAEGLALLAKIDTLKAARDAEAAKLKPFDDDLKAAGDALLKVNEQLIASGAGLYGDAEGHTCRVIAAVAATLTPDTFILPDGAEDEVRELTGDYFLKLFHRRVMHEPKNGFDGIADALLTPAKARKLVALCIVPGKPQGARASYVRWK